MADTSVFAKAIERALDNPEKRKAFLESLTKPNPLLMRLSGDDRWYVRLVRRFRPRWVHTFTEKRDWRKGLGMMPIEHGYWQVHPLGFLYRWAKKIALRKSKFKRVTETYSVPVSFKLRGKYE